MSKMGRSNNHQVCINRITTLRANCLQAPHSSHTCCRAYWWKYNEQTRSTVVQRTCSLLLQFLHPPVKLRCNVIIHSQPCLHFCLFWFLRQGPGCLLLHSVDPSFVRPPSSLSPVLPETPDGVKYRFLPHFSPCPWVLLILAQNQFLFALLLLTILFSYWHFQSLLVSVLCLLLLCSLSFTLNWHCLWTACMHYNTS